MEFDTVVVGAGLAGVTAAREMAECGRTVLVVEKRRYVGGNCHDRKNAAGITVHMHGPHIFHTARRDAWDWVRRFVGFRHYQHRVLSYVAGRFVPFPINLDTINEVFGMHLCSAEMGDFLDRQVQGSPCRVPPENFRDAVMSQVGERLYSLFYENYTRKQWGREPEELSADMAGRIPVRGTRDDRYFDDPFQGIPSLGYTDLAERALDHKNIALLLGVDYFDIRDQLDPRLTVYTGPLDRYFDYGHGNLEYRSLDFEFVDLDRDYYQPVAVVNYPNDYAWTRITEFKYFLGECGSKTTICHEYPKPTGEPYYIVPDPENTRRRSLYMTEVGRLEEAGAHVFVGRLAEYRYYNMDEVITEALTKVHRHGAVGGR